MAYPTQSTTHRTPAAKQEQCVGIWRLLECFHQGPWTDLFYAQPAEAAGSPRADYVAKMLSGNVEAQIEGHIQLRQEAASTRQVHHPNLVALLDERLNAPRPYLVFPRLDGQPLSTWLQGKYSQPLPVNLWWIRQAAQALQALHAASWVHGDVKPDNMMVSLRGHLTVIDLGLAMEIGTRPTPNRFQGTPAFSSPETIDGAESYQASSDIYSLGIVFYQMISRQPASVQPITPDMSRLQKASVPKTVIDLISTMTSASPKQRPTATQLVDAIFKLEIETLGMHIQPLDDAQSQAA